MKLASSVAIALLIGTVTMAAIATLIPPTDLHIACTTTNDPPPTKKGSGKG